MLQVHDIRETRVFQQGKEEGLKEGIEKGIAKSIAKLAAKEFPVAEIAKMLDVDVEQVRMAIAATEQ